MKIRLLGSGTSSGVPRIGNDWGACDPGEPRNRRTRCAALVSTATTRILIDTGADMREQLLRADVGDVDAVIWTHDHADHTHGIDDLRQIAHNRGRQVAGYARPHTFSGLERRFAYVFHGRGAYPPTVGLQPLDDSVTIGDVVVRVVDQPHGDITSAGLRFDHGDSSIVYSTDFHELTGDMETLYQGCDVWVVDALRHQPHPSHPHLEATLDYIARIRPRFAALIHMDQSMDYAALRASLPPGVEPGYDGMEIIA
ncbi:MBL fold metallo-hydrolase [Sphingomonas qomolangmaensis]|uniref:MBL fold metallo-hydrolase n=1 Tax=Sphingomonas qomolangmaensis TaxID=2918765 RepID=A0ABY5L921_9SPHN|nr:MBL fold metallo-hydrolase [Sphingomonas qomolangmaensis]UUL83465.1 MBL fold metallo-hydrolase [Sphingomonas qomolangmaensis]